MAAYRKSHGGSQAGDAGEHKEEDEAGKASKGGA